MFIPIITNFAMSITIFVFSAEVLSTGWPDSYLCHRYRPYDPQDPYRNSPLPETYECKQALTRVQIMVLVGGVMSIFVGLMLVMSLLLRLTAIVKTKFWQGMKMPFMGGVGGSGWSATGFTVQFTLKIIRPEDDNKANAVGAGEGSGTAKPTVQAAEEGRLIQT
jgi:hypothetical protein